MSPENLGPQFHTSGKTTYRIEPHPRDGIYGQRAVIATPEKGKQHVGILQFQGPTVYKGEQLKPAHISRVVVKENHRRRGVASAMLDYARKMQPDLQHDHALTAEGKAWSQARP